LRLKKSGRRYWGKLMLLFELAIDTAALAAATHLPFFYREKLYS
jgi:hypothetical protein